MKKEPFVFEFAIIDLQEMLEGAGFTWGHPKEVDPETLKHWEEKYDLPPAPKMMKPVVQATKLLMRFMIDSIRSNPPEIED